MTAAPQINQIAMSVAVRNMIWEIEATAGGNMDLSALHTVIRDMAKGIEPDMSQLGVNERAAIRTLQNRIRAAGGKLADVMPVSGSASWTLPAGKEVAI